MTSQEFSKIKEIIMMKMKNKDLLVKVCNYSSDQPYHLSPPAQPIDSTITLVLENALTQPEIVLHSRFRELLWRVQMTAEGETYVAKIMLPSKPTVIYYHFEFPDGRILRETRQIEKTRGANSPVYDEHEDLDFQIAVYDPNSMPPPWTQGMVIYQIFLDCFAKGKDEITLPDYDTYGQKPILKEWSDLPELPPRGRLLKGIRR